MYSYDHLIKQCELEKTHRKIFFDFISDFLELTGQLDDYHEKTVEKKDLKKLSYIVSELSDNIKGEVWRELERQNLDVIYEKEYLGIDRDAHTGAIIS